MTTTEETPAGPPVEPLAGGPEPQESPQDETDPNREAARYRRQLRAAETERDQLRGQVEAMQRQQVEAIAARDHGIAQPSSLWKAGTELADLLGDDGQIDPDKVGPAIDAAISSLGLAVQPRRPGPNYVPSEGTNPRMTDSPNAWQQFLQDPPQ